MLIKIDNYLMDKMQDMYDPLWNHYGVTKGAIQVIIKFMCIFTLFLDPTLDNRWRYFWCMFFFYSAYRNYMKVHVPQVKGEFKKLNKPALEARSGPPQKFKLFVILPVLLLFIGYNFSLMNYYIVTLLFIITFGFYVLTILIKDREPTNHSFSFNGV